MFIDQQLNKLLGNCLKTLLVGFVWADVLGLSSTEFYPKSSFSIHLILMSQNQTKSPLECGHSLYVFYFFFKHKCPILLCEIK